MMICLVPNSCRTRAMNASEPSAYRPMWLIHVAATALATVMLIGTAAWTAAQQSGTGAMDTLPAAASDNGSLQPPASPTASSRASVDDSATAAPLAMSNPRVGGPAGRRGGFRMGTGGCCGCVPCLLLVIIIILVLVRIRGRQR